jgi:hypothetical protein
MAEMMFDGFDPSEFKDEVIERGGETAYADSDIWWRGLSNAPKVDFQDASVSRIFDWVEGYERGLDPASDEAQTLAARSTPRGSATRTSPIPGSRRTTAASPARPSCATRCTCSPRRTSSRSA